MAKTNTAPFAQTKKTGVAIATAAKTTYGDAVNAVLLATAGAEGSLVRRITAIPRASNSASQLQLYRSSDGGVTLTLERTVLMAAATMSTSSVMLPTDLAIDFTKPMSLAGGATPERLYFAIGVALAGGVVATAELEDF